MRYLLSLLSGLAFAQATPNMGLVKPDVGDTNYRQKIDTILNQVDAHSHLSGSGVLITSSAIATGAITTSKIADRAITGVKIALNGISTQHIADGAVTVDKKSNMSTASQFASLGNMAVAPIATMTVTTSTFVLITDQIIGLQSSGRPVKLGVRATSGSPCFTTAQALTACEFQWRLNGVSVGTDNTASTIPCSAFSTITAPSAGSNIYSWHVRNSSGTFSCSATGVSIYGYEL